MSPSAALTGPGSRPSKALPVWQWRPDGPVPVLAPPPGWQRIDLVSDLHLGAHAPATLRAFLDYLERSPADALLLLGDVFEVWIGDDLLEAPHGPEAEVVAALRQAAQRMALAFLPGNRDFLVGAGFAAAAGCFLLPDPCLLQAGEQRLLLMHGDALCLDDGDYQAFRRQVRDPAWQAAFLARPLAERQALAAGMRGASETRKRQVGPEGYGDLDPAAMNAALEAAHCALLVHGHTHRPATESLGAGRQRWVLSDWDLEPSQPAPRAEVLRLQSDGLHRLPLAQALPP